MNTKDEYDAAVLLRDQAEMVVKTAKRNALDASVEHGQVVIHEMHLRHVAHITKTAKNEADHVFCVADRLVSHMAQRSVELQETE